MFNNPYTTRQAFKDDDSDESDFDYSSDDEDYFYEDDSEQDEDDNDDDFDYYHDDLIEEQKREEIAQSVALRGVVVYQKHFIQAAKKLTPSLSKEELDHYAKIKQQFSSKRQKK
jgi:SpoVK/Ycf46/Vps4 family AAA+-type ATPase